MQLTESETTTSPLNVTLNISANVFKNYSIEHFISLEYNLQIFIVLHHKVTFVWFQTRKKVDNHLLMYA